MKAQVWRESGPGAGAAIAGIGSFAGGGIMVGILALRELVEWLHKLREESAEAQKALSEIGIAARDSAEAAAKAQNEFITRLDKTKEKVDSITTAYDLQKAALEAQIEHHKATTIRKRRFAPVTTSARRKPIPHPARNASTFIRNISIN
jgi:hypothetical protein